MKKEELKQRMEAYLKKFPPDTGYTRRAVEAIINADLPSGENIGVQLALQYDGKETPQDLIFFDDEQRESQLPYKPSYSLDVGADCADFCRNIILLLFGRNIGDYTEGIYQRYKYKKVAWKDRRPLDVVLWKFSDRNPNATHAAFYIGGGNIIHTTSVGAPLRVQADTYGAVSRVGAFRVLTDDEYNSLIVNELWTGGSKSDMISTGDNRKVLVAQIQKKLVALGYDIGTYKSVIDGAADGSDGAYGAKTKAAVTAFQKTHGIGAENIGAVDFETLIKIDEVICEAKTGKLTEVLKKIAEDTAKYRV